MSQLDEERISCTPVPLNSLTPVSDQDRISPYHIYTDIMQTSDEN